MSKFKTLLISVLLPLGLVAGVQTAAPSQASPTAYSYVQHIMRGDGGVIWVVCHSNKSIQPLGVGQHSRQVCGMDGWVDGIRSAGIGVSIRLRNIATGQVTQYPRGYNGNIPGGYYDAWNNCC